MRLMCPNCEAQYEVSDSVIPLHGRDVQCSNCGQTWFQTHPQAEPEAVDEEDVDFGGEDSLPNVAAGAWDASDPGEGAPDTRAASADVPARPDATAITSFPPDPDAPAPPAAGVPAPEPDAAPDPETEPQPTSFATETAGDRGAEDLPPEDLSPLDLPPEGARPEDLVPEDLVPEDLPPEALTKTDDDFATPAETVAAAVGTLGTPPAEPKRRSLDEAVLSVLREEAEREAKARRAAGGVETQTDLNLPAAEPPPRVNAGLDSLPRLRVQPQAESHVADLSTGGARRPVEDLSQPIEPDVAEIPATQRHSRRDLLPDIEAFSSSLQAGGGKAALAAATEAEPRPARRSGFRTGFLLMILLAVLVFGLYAAAPALGNRFPAAVPMLNQFVATIDKGRVMIDQLMQSSLDQLKADEKPVE